VKGCSTQEGVKRDCKRSSTEKAELVEKRSMLKKCSPTYNERLAEKSKYGYVERQTERLVGGPIRNTKVTNTGIRVVKDTLIKNHELDDGRKSPIEGDCADFRPTSMIKRPELLPLHFLSLCKSLAFVSILKVIDIHPIYFPPPIKCKLYVCCAYFELFFGLVRHSQIEYLLTLSPTHFCCFGFFPGRV
jgi:hypothetical protein